MNAPRKCYAKAAFAKHHPLDFFNLLDLCKKVEVVEGDFKSSDIHIADEEIRLALEKRKTDEALMASDYSAYLKSLQD